MMITRKKSNEKFQNPVTESSDLRLFQLQMPSENNNRFDLVAL